jgi:hypothetical protein
VRTTAAGATPTLDAVAAADRSEFVSPAPPLAQSSSAVAASAAAITGDAMSSGKRLAKRSILGTRVVAQLDDGKFYPGIIQVSLYSNSSSIFYSHLLK